MTNSGIAPASRPAGITNSGICAREPARENYQFRRCARVPALSPRTAPRELPIPALCPRGGSRELPNPATTSGCRRTGAPKFAGEDRGEKKSPEAHYGMLLAREKVRFDFLKSPSLGPERFYFVFCLFFPGKNEKSARTKCG